MATDNWHYLENQFDNATQQSRKRMQILSNEHIASLDAEKSDGDIAALLTNFEPVHLGFTKVYTDWLKAKGIYNGATQVVEEALAELTAKKVPQWDNKIRSEVGENSSDHTALLPAGREPFQKGGRDARINEVEGLAKRLAGYNNLAAVKTDAQNFHTKMKQARHDQQTKENDVQQISDELESKRKDLAVVMYADLGRLMAKFAAHPENIARFFDLEVLRQTGAEEEEVEPVLDTQSEPVKNLAEV